jgi:predicted TIM-barrel fold metal-dependent hydrolase
MRRAGIDEAAIMPIATRPSQVRSINNWVSEISKVHDDIIAFATINPKQDDWQDEIDYIVGEGFPGVKMHPDYQEFYVDDLALTPIYKALADAGLILLLHSGVDVGLPPPVHCTPERLARMLDVVPDLTVIAAHMGGCLCWDDVERHLVGRNLYFDTCYSLSYLGPERMTSLIKAHGPDRILFATDSPWTDQSQELAGIRALDLTEDEITAILGENASRLLNEP